MSSFLLALQFLTIIPVKVNYIDDKQIAKSTIYFPIIGLLLGLVLAGTNNLLCLLVFAPLSINIVLVISLAFLTGGIHLDGLADSADAFLSRKKKEEMLGIMRDSHIGAMGVLSLISIILLKIALLLSLNTPLKTASLLLMCTLSRWSMVFLMFLFSYARQEGKARAFFQGMNPKIFIFSTIMALICAFTIWQIKALVIFVIIAVCSYVIGWSINKKLGGVTGDTLGATNEMIEVMTLLCICILERSLAWIR